MKLALFGATGSVGRHVLRLAIEGGHQANAFVRDRSKLNAATATACHVIVGSLENRDAVRYALEGCDAVIVTLAAGNGVLAAFDAAALPVLKIHGPRRVVSLVGASVRMPGDPSALSLNVMSMLMRLIPGGFLRDAEGHAARLRSSGLDWTLARAANFNGAPATGKVRAEPAFAMPLGATVARADLADFMLDAALNGRHVGEAPMICNAA